MRVTATLAFIAALGAGCHGGNNTGVSGAGGGSSSAHGSSASTSSSSGGGGADAGGMDDSPDVMPGNGDITVFNTVPPTHYGNPGDYGYDLRGFAHWDDPPLIEVGQSGVNGTRHIGLVAAHLSTDAELATGKGSNICSVKVRIDRGAWYTIPAKSANPDAGNYVDWNFTVNSKNFTDGLHRVDAEVVPCTGPSIIMEGPLEDANHYAGARVSEASISDGTGNAPGNVLTITGTVANLAQVVGKASAIDGWSVEGVGTAPNTFIDKTQADDPTYTGTGSAGTYHVTGEPQLVPPTPMMIGNERSFYFITDYHDTLGRGTHVAYVSASGADTNSGVDAGHPMATIAAARNVIWAQDTMGHGKYGGVVCLMDGMNVMTNSGNGNPPDSSLGWLTIQGADHAPCVHPGDKGNPKMHFDVNNRTYGGLRVWYAWMSFDQQGPSTFDDGSPEQLVAEHATVVGNVYNGGMLGAGGLACLETTSHFTYGGCTAPLVRNANINYNTEDTFHGPELVLGTKSTGGGNVFTWSSATATMGSNVLTNVTVPAGYTISQIFTPGHDCTTENLSCIGLWNGTTNCLPEGSPDTSIVSVDEVNHTITLDQMATCSATGWPEVPGVHGDISQIQVNTYSADVFYEGNDFNVTFPGFQQGWFLEADKVSGVYLGNNTWRNDHTAESIILVNGGNDKVIYENNTWTTSGGFRQDVAENSTDETFVNDVCTNGGGFTAMGTHLRYKAAVKSPCYKSSP